MNNTISITTKLQDIINLPKKSTIISSSIAWKNSIGSIRALTKRKEEGSITLSIRMKLLSITRTPYSESQPLNRAWVDRLFRIFSEGRLNCPESQKSNQQTSASSISWRRCPQKLISLATECQLKFRITDLFIFMIFILSFTRIIQWKISSPLSYCLACRYWSALRNWFTCNKSLDTDIGIQSTDRP